MSFCVGRAGSKMRSGSIIPLRGPWCATRRGVWPRYCARDTSRRQGILTRCGFFHIRHYALLTESSTVSIGLPRCSPQYYHRGVPDLASTRLRISRTERRSISSNDVHNNVSFSRFGTDSALSTSSIVSGTDSKITTGVPQGCDMR